MIRLRENNLDRYKQCVYTLSMIVSFADKETEKIFSGKKTRLVPPDIVKRAIMRLDRIDAATCIDDLRFPPSFENGIAHNVEIVDYH